VAEMVDAAGEHRVGGEYLVDERKHDDPDTQPGQLGELGEDVVVGDPGGPATSRKCSTAAGVARQCTDQPCCWARVTMTSIRRAGPAAQTTR
jgi:hypothetical protein